MYSVALKAKDRKDDVKLGTAFTKLTEEDPSITIIHDASFLFLPLPVKI